MGKRKVLLMLGWTAVVAFPRRWGRSWRALCVVMLTFVPMVSARMAFAEDPIIITGPAQNNLGEDIYADDLRRVLRNIDAYADESTNSRFVYGPPALLQIEDRVFDACGQHEAFATYNKTYGYLPYQLLDGDREMLETCLKGVFEFADEVLGFAAPGFYRRFDRDYVTASVNLGHDCGYRTQQSFAHFALAVWLIYPLDLQNSSGWMCLGEFSAEVPYIDDSLFKGVRHTVDNTLFLNYYFGNWLDVLRYQNYKKMVITNRDKQVCTAESIQFVVDTVDSDLLVEVLGAVLVESGCLE